MVALGLVTTEHLEGKMAYVLQLRFWVKSFLSAAPQPNETALEFATFLDILLTQESKLFTAWFLFNKFSCASVPWF